MSVTNVTVCIYSHYGVIFFTAGELHSLYTATIAILQMRSSTVKNTTPLMGTI